MVQFLSKRRRKGNIEEAFLANVSNAESIGSALAAFQGDGLRPTL